MTPKQKAIELVNIFREFVDGTDPETDRYSPNIEKKNGKKCTLKVVDEIIAEIEPSVSMDVIEARIKYWNEVKQEIEKL